MPKRKLRDTATGRAAVRAVAPGAGEGEVRARPGNRLGAQCATSKAAKPLADLGISYTLSSRWQQLADISADEFDGAILT
jgi:hypothetical protein